MFEEILWEWEELLSAGRFDSWDKNGDKYGGRDLVVEGKVWDVWRWLQGIVCISV